MLCVPKIERYPQSSVRQWMMDYVDRLMSQGDWEHFAELVIQKVDYNSMNRSRVELGAAEVTEVKIFRDGVMDWCGMNFPC